MHATWLLQVLDAEGLHVVEMTGWRTRETRPGFDPQGIVLHHTATPKTASDLNVRKLLRDGRPDLSGPLCQMGLERDGTFVLVAAGRANHAGYGKPWGNDSFGIEAYNDGKGEPWAPAQLDAWVRGCAAICRYRGWDPATRIKGHREVDPGRKIDPHGIDLDRFRRDVADEIAPPAPPIEPKGDDMFTYEYDAEGAAPNVLILVAGGKQCRITNQGVRDRRAAAKETHLGPVDKTEYDAFEKAYGKVIG